MSSDPFVPLDDEAEATLPELLELHAQQIRGRIHTGLVCRVESYNAERRTANVQPVTQGRYINGDRFSLPVLPNVPVAFPGGGDFELTFPISKGHYVFVSFAERSIDEWKAGGGINIAPQDLRRFSLSDGVIVGTIDPPGTAPAADADNLVIGQRSTGGLTVTIYAGGKITIGTDAAELLAIIDSALTALQTFSTATSAAVIEPTLGPASAALSASLTTISSLLSTIKGP